MLGFSEEAVPALGALYPDQASIFKEENAELLKKAKSINEDATKLIASLPYSTVANDSELLAIVTAPHRAPQKYEERNHAMPDICQDDELRPGLTFRERQEIDARLFKSTASISYSHMQGGKYWYNVGSEADMKNITDDYTIRCLGLEMQAGDHCTVSNHGRETITYVWDGRIWKMVGGTSSTDSYIEECDAQKRGLCCIVDEIRQAGYDDGYDDGCNNSDNMPSTEIFYDYMNEMLNDGNPICVEHVNIHKAVDGVIRVQMPGNVNIYVSNDPGINTDKHLDLGMDRKSILVNRNGDAYCMDMDDDMLTALVAEDSLEDDDDFDYKTVDNVRHYVVNDTSDLADWADAPIGSVAIKNTVRNGSPQASNTIWKKLARGWVMSLCDKTDTGS